MNSDEARSGQVSFDEARLVQMIDNPGEYSPRFVATMQGSMTEAVENGVIRNDVFYRLSGATIELPSLRECVDDILILSDHFLKLLETEGGPRRKLAVKSQDLFRAYSWPGNVRELENVIQRALVLSDGKTISAEDIIIDNTLYQSGGQAHIQNMLEKQALAG